MWLATVMRAAIAPRGCNFSQWDEAPWDDLYISGNSWLRTSRDHWGTLPCFHRCHIALPTSKTDVNTC